MSFCVVIYVKSICVSVFNLAPRFLDDWCLKIEESNFIIFFKNTLAPLFPLPFQIHFRISFSISTKYFAGILIGILLNIRSVDVLTMLNFLVHEHNIALDLFTSFFLYFISVLLLAYISYIYLVRFIPKWVFFFEQL